MAQQDNTIRELVNKIKRNEIRLPEMQRQYVWRKTRVRDLLDSLYRNYPSGFILTWETGDNVATRNFAIEQDKPAGHNFQLLLDGQQRLTSLSAILNGELVSVRGRKNPIDILFNLEHPEIVESVIEADEDDIENDNNTDDENDIEETELADASEDELLKQFNEMTFVVHNKKLAALPHWVSVTDVFKKPGNEKFLKQAGVKNFDDSRYNKYSDRLNRLRKIENYSYRVHILEREKSYEEVTEIFVRINSLGVKLRSSDLALAHITAKWRGSLELFQKFEKECKGRGFDLDLSIHLKNLVSFATHQSKFHIVRSLSKKKLEENWKEQQKGMNFALNFIQSNVGIDKLVLLSSPFIIISIAAYAHKRNYELSSKEERALRHWTLLANAKGRYSRGSSETLLDEDLNAVWGRKDVPALLQNLNRQVGRLEIESTDIEGRNQRSAYFKTMFLAFKANGAKDWGSQLAISLKHKGASHALEFHHIFPRKILEGSKIPKEKINDIANLCFISAKTNKQIRDREPINYFPDFIKECGEDEIAKQAIPTNRKLWQVDRFDDFLEERRRLIVECLNEFLNSKI